LIAFDSVLWKFDHNKQLFVPYSIVICDLLWFFEKIFLFNCSFSWITMKCHHFWNQFKSCSKWKSFIKIICVIWTFYCNKARGHSTWHLLGTFSAVICHIYCVLRLRDFELWYESVKASLSYYRTRPFVFRNNHRN